MKTKNYFTELISPYHLSVGAVVFNKEGKIGCHHFKEGARSKTFGKIKDDIYILMRETMEPNESIEEALQRGLLEEFGAEAELVNYIGSIVSQFNSERVKNIQKTTIYFLMKLVDIDENKRAFDDDEYESSIEWKDIDFPVNKMKRQRKLLGRSDADESLVLERVCNEIRKEK